MSLYDDYIGDYRFELEHPFGFPSDKWKTKDGKLLKITEMTDNHIKNCMKLVTINDDWYIVFANELQRRHPELKIEYPNRYLF